MKDTLVIAQCEANCRSLFDHYGLPSLKTMATQVDRTMFKATAQFLRYFTLLDQPWSMVPDRFETWPFNQEHGTTAVRGWRERVPCFSMQIIEHSTGWLEVDFDLSNPNYGLALAIGHLAEVLKHKFTGCKTNSFSILKGLRKRGIPVPDVREIKEV